MKKLYYCIILLFAIQPLLLAQVPKLKNPNEAVQDYANVLSDQERMLLNAKLAHYADSTSTGIVIAIVPTTNDDINFQAAEILSEWKIGQKGKDNGVLILMASEQRKVAISTGYGVEEYLTDALSKQIITQDMIPHFRQGNYYAGFDSATTSIMQVLSGTYKNDVTSTQGIPFSVIVIFGIAMLLLIIALSRGGKGGNNSRGGGGFDLFDMIILSSMGRNSGGFGGGFGGGGSSGGFGGFGGGMGGGGGASGSW